MKALYLFIIFSLIQVSSFRQQNHEKPNILWITCEDISPYLSCYGDSEALTPNIDKLAEEGTLFTRAFANAPVCAVSRSTILTGMYSTTLGTHQMRSMPQLPANIPNYPSLLRENGYYCTNNSKTDYNSNYEKEKKLLWDEVSSEAHWKNAPDKTPFFSVFNITNTHESQLSQDRIKHYVSNEDLPKSPRINPKSINLPPYHPDLPEIRQDWARLYDQITFMDSKVGTLLEELAQSGKADNTIIFFYSDHGGQLSGSKRYIYSRGTHIPLIVYFPKKWQHLNPTPSGQPNDELVSFIDFPKTILSITESTVPAKMQGRIFLGPDKEKGPDYTYFYRDRMGARYDFSRAVTDGTHYYIYNFYPHKPRGRDSRYGHSVQTNWGAWEKHYDAGKTNRLQSLFFKPKPTEQLFNIQKDPWNIENLAGEKKYKKTQEKLSRALDQWIIDTKDIGLIPEPMIYELIGSDKKYKTIYEFAQSPEYPVEDILHTAKLSSQGPNKYETSIQSKNPVIRYWGIYGLFRTENIEESSINQLKTIAINDPSATNRVMAIQTLGKHGQTETAFDLLMKEAKNTKVPYLFLMAINAFQYGKLDHLLSKDDWERFKSKEFSLNENQDQYGGEYALRIINDALDIWPKRRKVY
ncbi:sulfatase family protein [Membranihabitans maritimus]|uniref:sulfatase family protein n=1 Tax=Membranihabitans maritimus TaxID=2904244 RepID=UPI001F2F8B75|nr:sulfatase [Membranihabitans maritimus]